MAWHAKPSGPYSSDGQDGQDNMLEIYSYLYYLDYTDEAVGGVVGNVMAESGLNPWRWQSDTVNLNAGYGLFQYTPARGYIDGGVGLSNYSPNLSTTSITSGATPEDGIAQLEAFDTNLLGKWVPTCWRSYWSQIEYSQLYKERARILKQYGSNGRITMDQFKQIDILWDATFVFLACFEGPAKPTIDARYELATKAYVFITGHDPLPPNRATSSNFWLYLRRPF